MCADAAYCKISSAIEGLTMIPEVERIYELAMAYGIQHITNTPTY